MRCLQSPQEEAEVESACEPMSQAHRIGPESHVLTSLAYRCYSKPRTALRLPKERNTVKEAHELILRGSEDGSRAIFNLPSPFGACGPHARQDKL